MCYLGFDKNYHSFIFHLKFFIGVELIYSVLLVSG